MFWFQPFQSLPRLQSAGHRPCLGGCAAWMEGWSTVENFADGAQSGTEQMIANRVQAGLGRRRIAMNPIFGQGVMAQ